MGCVLFITPHGRLSAGGAAGAAGDLSPEAATILEQAFATSSGAGLLALAGLDAAALSPPFRWARDFTCQYLSRLCHIPDFDVRSWPVLPPPDSPALAGLVEAAPPMRGLEYLSPAVLATAWSELDGVVKSAMQAAGGTPQAFLQAIHPDWRLVGRVTFHLAENKRDPARPFAFMATYTSRLNAQSKPQYLPLGRALEEYAGADRRDALLSLLTPVNRASENCTLVRELVESGRIYRPLAWTAGDAFRFLKEIPACEQAGVLVRVPDWWKGGRPARPQVSVRIGSKPATGLGADALLDFTAEATLDGEPLTEQEWRSIRESAGGLVPLRGQWVEVDRGKLEDALRHFREAQKLAREGVSFAEAMRMLAGADVGGSGGPSGVMTPEARAWVGVLPGPWLEETLSALRDPGRLKERLDLSGLRATLRPYQESGVQWLWFMSRLGLGACLADDMGLGKTVQLLALLLALKRDRAPAVALADDGGKAPASSLLIVPASLIANWKSEIARFAPSLVVRIVHPSETPAATLASWAKKPALLDGADLVIATYGMMTRQDWLSRRAWRLVVLDEAQAIKNAGARQSRAVKAPSAACRIALTGTPVENRLSDLWSLFDFLNPGLLGSASAFGRYAKALGSGGDSSYAPLRALVKPYILRRLKTDRRVIADLPDKTEVAAYCALSPAQAALYQKAVSDLAADLDGAADPTRRRGLILAYLLRFKQICNHPSHWLGDGVFAEADSGKYARLRDLVEELAERQEKALVFTQFREMTAPLADYLARLYERPGLVLHGGTPVAGRRKLVEDFQREDGPPFFVLSLKAGGTGLNLTEASHVIHFDRWWNPAVENQATDRAFRIGQRKNVLVHKFVCRGTLEERIDRLIEEKKGLAEALLGGGGEKLLTDMGNEELVRFVSLDINAIQA